MLEKRTLKNISGCLPIFFCETQGFQGHFRHFFVIFHGHRSNFFPFFRVIIPFFFKTRSLIYSETPFNLTRLAWFPWGSASSNNRVFHNSLQHSFVFSFYFCFKVTKFRWAWNSFWCNSSHFSGFSGSFFKKSAKFRVFRVFGVFRVRQTPCIMNVSVMNVYVMNVYVMNVYVMNSPTNGTEQHDGNKCETIIIYSYTYYSNFPISSVNLKEPRSIRIYFHILYTKYFYSLPLFRTNYFLSQ